MWHFGWTSTTSSNAPIGATRVDLGWADARTRCRDAGTADPAPDARMQDRIARTTQRVELPRRVANQRRQAPEPGAPARLLRDDTGKKYRAVTVRPTRRPSGTRGYRCLIEPTFLRLALRHTVCSHAVCSQEATMDEGTKTCPRCGGAVHTLRRFTRWGRPVAVVVGGVCRYTEFAAGSA